jgi:hypothetical protein
MRVFDENKIQELFYYDLEKGYLRDDELFVKHHEAKRGTDAVWHYETVKKYPNGGNEVKKVIDVAEIPSEPSWDEYEKIMVYVPYNAEELKERRISQIKERLSQLSEDFIQSFAGAVISDIDVRKSEFAKLHNELRALLGKEQRTYY